jgi:hypothetical protein
MGLFIMVFGIIGLSAGPLVVALVTDHVFHDPAKIGLSIATTAVLAGTVSFLMFLACLKPAREAIAAARRDHGNGARHHPEWRETAALNRGDESAVDPDHRSCDIAGLPAGKERSDGAKFLDGAKSSGR